MEKYIFEHTTYQTFKQMGLEQQKTTLLSSKNRKLRLQFAFTKIGQQKLGKNLSGMMSFDFCCNIWLGSEFSINNGHGSIMPGINGSG